MLVQAEATVIETQPMKVIEVNGSALAENVIPTEAVITADTR